jgi:hypothetical protein
MTRAAGTRQALARLKARQREPGYEEWHTTRYGRCWVCGRSGTILRHHVVYEQHVRRAGGDPWDLRNSMDVGALCTCHLNHHSATRRILRRRLPSDALGFADELLGPERAADYIKRYYGEES